jgi:hypothetical protein
MAICGSVWSPNGDLWFCLVTEWRFVVLFGHRMAICGSVWSPNGDLWFCLVTEWRLLLVSARTEKGIFFFSIRIVFSGQKRHFSQENLQ